MALYSPKIKEDLIPRIYRLARHNGTTMTKVVDQVLRPVIENLSATGLFKEIEKEELIVKQLTDHFHALLSDRKTKTAKVIELLRKIA
jgi:hypothetical protein